MHKANGKGKQDDGGATQILVGHSWQGTRLATHLSSLAKITYSQDLGVVDFYPSDQLAVLFINEADLIAGNSYKRRAVKFRQITNLQRGVVMAQKTGFTSEQYSKLQKFVSIELGLAVIPVKAVEEAAQLLANMAMCEAKTNFNPFRVRRKKSNIPDQLVLSTMEQVPGLGGVRATALLEKFGSIQGVAAAGEKAMAEVVGIGPARVVHKFFHVPPI